MASANFEPRIRIIHLKIISSILDARAIGVGLRKPLVRFQRLIVSGLFSSVCSELFSDFAYVNDVDPMIVVHINSGIPFLMAKA